MLGKRIMHDFATFVVGANFGLLVSTAIYYFTNQRDDFEKKRRKILTLALCEIRLTVENTKSPLAKDIQGIINDSLRLARLI